MNIRKSALRIISIACLLIAVLCNFTVFAKTSETETSRIIISIYNDISNEYILENTALDITENMKVSDLFDTLKKERYINDYSVDDNHISTITTNTTTVYTHDPSVAGTTIYAKINAKASQNTNVNTILRNGDIVEIFYTTKKTLPAQISSAITSQPETKITALTLWDTELVKVFNDSFEWINRNIETSNSYLLVLGVASKAPNVKNLNQLQTEVSKNKNYKTPTEIAKDTISLTLNGIDASSKKNNQLIQKLSSYPNIMNMGIFGGVNTITAYDCNNYYVPETSLNSRKILITEILKYQNDDGGFRITETSKSDIDTTAMTITALSEYTERQDVKAAIDKAINYLSNVQRYDGGFSYDDVPTLESLSTVIVALNSLGIPLDDERFEKGELTLVENMMQYRNSDGGFSHLIDGKSTAMPTEQALIALTSIKKSGNPYKLATPIKSDPAAEPTESITMKLDNAPTIILIATVLAIISIATIAILLIGKRSNKKK